MGSNEDEADMSVLTPGPLKPFIKRQSAARVEGRFVEVIDQTMLFRDPPDHTRLRALVSKAFTPKRVEALAGRVGQLVDELMTQTHEPAVAYRGGRRWAPLFEPVGLERNPPERAPLRSGVYIGIGAPPGSVDMEKLWLSKGRLVKGADPIAAARQPYQDHDYLVLEVERLETRDDWPSLPGITEFQEKIAAILSIVESCRRLKISVRGYLAAILPGLADFPIQHLSKVTPQAWAAQQP